MTSDQISKAFSTSIALLLIIAFTLSATLLLPSVQADPGDTIIVDLNGNGDHTTVQAAIDAASDGDTISIWEGLYLEDLVIDKMLTIVGNGTDQTIINGTGTGDAITVTSDWVNITTLAVTGSMIVYEEPPPFYAGILLEGVENCSIDSVRVFDNYAGILLNNTNNTTVTNVTASGNMGGFGILSSHGNNITNNTISDNVALGMMVIGSNQNVIAWNEVSSCEENGIIILESDGNDITNNTVHDCGIHGILLDESSNNNVLDNSVWSCSAGIGLMGGTGNVIGHNQVSNCSNNGEVGIYIENSNQIRVFNNTLSDNYYGIDIYETQYAIIENNTVTECRYGIYLEDVVSCNVLNNSVSGNEYGIYVSLSENCTIVGNTVYWNENGTSVENSVNITVSNNSFHDNEAGIIAEGIVNSLFSDNNLTGSMFAIQVFGFMNIEVVSNKIHDNMVGFISSGDGARVADNDLNNEVADIAIFSSLNYVIENNTMVSGLHVEGDLLEEWDTHIVAVNNTVGGKPLLYIIDQIGGDVTGPAGQVFLVNSSHVTVTGLHIQSRVSALSMAFSHNNTVESNEFHDNFMALNLLYSHDNNITDNIIASSLQSSTLQSSIYLGDSDRNNLLRNTLVGGYDYGAHLERSYGNNISDSSIVGVEEGIYIEDSDGNVISGNIIERNNIGLELDNSNDNFVFFNVFLQNEYGILVYSDSSDNVIVGNDFIDNDEQAKDYGDNIWNLSAEDGGGNYWNDHLLEDADEDGYADLEYNFDVGAVDWLQLMRSLDDEKPNADAGGDINAYMGIPRLLDGTGSSDDRAIKNYSWYITDDDVYVYGRQPSYVFTSEGTYTVVLNVTDYGGNFDTDEITVTVTEREPVYIHDVNELQAMADDLYGYYILANDIDASSTIGWNSGMGFMPVGSMDFDDLEDMSQAFQGALDGNGFTINGLHIDRPEQFAVGLFAVLAEQASVSNLTLSEINITGGLGVGGIAGANFGEVVNCSVSGNVTGVSMVGGLMAMNGGVVDSATAAVDVNAIGTFDFDMGEEMSLAGGLLGMNQGWVNDSHATGAVVGEIAIGGLVAINMGQISNCSASGDVVGDTLVGGLVAFNDGSLIDSHANGDVTATGIMEMMGMMTSAAGGLVGFNTEDIEGCSATGDVTGVAYVGGLVGINMGLVDGSHAEGEVTTTGNVLFFGELEVSVGGGLVGMNGGIINSSIATGDVFGDIALGGLVGLNDDGQITECDASGNVTGVEVLGGLVGVNMDGWVSDSNSHGNVTATGVIPVDEDFMFTLAGGGLVGMNGGNIIDCQASGEVRGPSVIGGLVGFNEGIIIGSSAVGDVVGEVMVGGLVAFNNGEIIGCHAEGDVTATATVQMGPMEISGAGGLVAMNDGDIIDSHAHGDVQGGSTVGGLAAFNEGVIEGSSSQGAVTGLDFVGGLVGMNSETIINSVSSSIVSGVNRTGGLVGINMDGLVENSSATGDVQGISSVGGLVGYNQGLVNNSHYIGTVNGHKNTGGLVGFNTGQLLGCYASVTVVGTADIIGGLVGDNRGDVIECYAHGDVSGENNTAGLVASNRGLIASSYFIGQVHGNDNVGGLVSTNYGNITDSYSGGMVDGNQNVGGLVGFCHVTAEVVGCNSSAEVNGTLYVGGLIGLSQGLVENSYATGNVNGSDQFCGGLVGQNNGLVNTSYATGNVEGFNFVGGLLGVNRPTGTVNDSYSRGNVLGNSGVGGLIGLNEGDVNRCYSTGEVGDATADGGLIGSNTGTVSDSFWDSESSGKDTSDGGLAKTTIEMMDPLTFTAVGWDFDDTWFIVDGLSYPLLHYQPLPLIAYAGDDQSVKCGTTVTLDGSGSTAAVNWTWTFTDGVPITLYGETTEHVFNDEGNYIVTLTVRDAEGNTDSDTMTVEVTLTMDLILTIISPTNNSYVNVTDVFVEWEVDYDEVYHINVSYDGIDWIPVSEDNYTFVALTEDVHTLYVNATDADGEHTVRTLTVTVDLTDPEIDIYNPPDDSYIDSDSVTVNWTVTDDSDWTAEVSVDGGDWTYVGMVDGYVITGLAEGEHILSVRVTDAAGNINSSSVTVIVDTIDPELDIHSPLDGHITNASIILVEWTVDDVSPVTVNISYDGSTWLASDTPDNHTFDLLEGANVLWVRAVDAAGNENITSITVVMDTGLPQIDITSPGEGSFVNSTSVLVEWTVDDDSPVTMYISLDNATWVLADTLDNHTFTGLDEVETVLWVRAVDAAGNENVTNVTVTIDVTLPELTITSPADDSINSTGNVIVNWTVVETNPWNAEVSVDGGAWVDIGTVEGHEFTGLDDGLRSLSVRIVDAAGNVNQSSVSVMVDTTPPEIEIVTPEESVNINSTEVFVEWIITDALPVSVNISTDGSTWLDADTPDNHTFTGLGEGSHALWIRAIDEAGNVNVTSVTVIVDLTAPLLNITSPADGSLNNTGTVVVNWTVIEDNEWTAEVSVDGGAWTDIGKVLGYEFTDLAEGERNLSVRVTDAAGNSNQSSVDVMVDTSEPELDITAPTDGLYTNASTVLVQWTVDDATAVTVSISYDGTTWSLADTAVGHNFDLVEGANVLWVRAVDALGHENVTNITVNMDTVAPQLTITSPAAGSINSTGTVSVTWAVVDENDWTAEVSVDGTTWTPIGIVNTHAFTSLADGSHTLYVRVTDDAGNSNVSSVAVNVDKTAPVASAGADRTVEEGTVVTFDGSASTDNIGVTNHTWTFTYGGETVTLYGVSPSHTFGTAGTYMVTLTVRDAAGNEDTDTMTVTVTAEEEEEEEESVCFGVLVFAITAMLVLPVFMVRRFRLV